MNKTKFYYNTYGSIIIVRPNEGPRYLVSEESVYLAPVDRLMKSRPRYSMHDLVGCLVGIGPINYISYNLSGNAIQYSVRGYTFPEHELIGVCR